MGYGNKTVPIVDIHYKYDLIKSKVKKYSTAEAYIDELISNIGNLSICCNPDCKKRIDHRKELFMVFDGIYCSVGCKTNAIRLLLDLWLED